MTLRLTCLALAAAALTAAAYVAEPTQSPHAELDNRGCGSTLGNLSYAWAMVAISVAAAYTVASRPITPNKEQQ